MAEESGEKSQDATEHRRQQARDEGQVTHSQDLNSAALLLGGLLILIFTGGALLQFLVAFLAGYLSGEPWAGLVNSGLPMGSEQFTSQWNAAVIELAKVLLPVLGLMALLAVAINLL